MIVVDASVLALALGNDGCDGAKARTRLRGEELAAPSLIDLEVTSVVRRKARIGELEQQRAQQALADLADLPLHRSHHHALLPRVWELRDNVSPYDASYVALAESLDSLVLTVDGRLARATGPRCRVETLD